MCRTLLATVLLAGLATGCQYAGDRLDDLGDCFQINGGAGLGLYVHLTATDYIKLPLGWKHCPARAGWDPFITPRVPAGESGWTWKESAVAYLFRSWDYRDPVRAADNPDAQAAMDRKAVVPILLERFGTRYGGEPSLGPEARAEEFADRCWIEADVFAAVLGVRVGFNVVQFADFLGGLATLDLLGDDGGPVTVILPRRPKG